MRVGSLVVCINKQGWGNLETGTSVPGPVFNGIYIVSGFPKPDYITLEEFPELDENRDTEYWDITQFKEIQPPMDIDIEDLIKETLEV